MVFPPARNCIYVGRKDVKTILLSALRQALYNAVSENIL